MDLKKIWLSSPHMGGEEFERVREAFDTNWIAPWGLMSMGSNAIYKNTRG